MSVEVYVGRRFQHGHERRAFGEFAQDLFNRYENSPEPYFVIAEFEAGAASIDLLLLSPRAMIIADLKELQGARSLPDVAQVRLRGKPNGAWQYLLDDGAVYPIGGESKTDNPYQQLEQHRYRFADWVARHSSTIVGETWTKEQVLDRLDAWVVISPGFDGDASHLDLPWDEIRRHHSWFRVIALKQLAWEFNCTSHAAFGLSSHQLRRLIVQLGVERLPDQELRQILPDYVPPAPKIPFFGRPRAPGKLIGRDCETAELASHLDNDSVSIICLRGPGGVGKTELAAWLAQRATSKRYRTWWVDCAIRDVTDESFLAAVAGEIEDRYQAGLILDKERSQLPDRMDAALDALDREPTFIILDDFHKVSRDKGLDRFLTHLVQRSSRTKLGLVTRERPSCLDNPGWPSGVAKEIIITGMRAESLSTFFEVNAAEALTEEHQGIVWERTEGNPYAMRLLMSIVRQYGWEEPARALPLYSASHSEPWFASLLETLTDDARQLAFRLSVFRTHLSQDLIAFVSHNPRVALALTTELLDKHIIQEAAPHGSFTTHAFVREYLYDRWPETKRVKAHQDAGKYYARLADQATDDRAQASYLIEAIHHFALAPQWGEVLSRATLAFQLLNAAGDWDQAQNVASQALKAARGAEKREQIAHWLIELASRELEQDQMVTADKHLREAGDHLFKGIHKPADSQRMTVLRLDSRLAIQRGRLAYFRSEYDAAVEHFNRALQNARQIQNPHLEADCLVRIGRVELKRARFDDARQKFDAAGQIAMAQGDHRLAVECSSHTGLIARAQGDLAAAKRLFETAYHEAEKADDLRGAEINHSLMGDLALRTGDYTQAEKVFRHCLAISRRLGNGLGIRINAGQLAETLIHLGSFEEAESLLKEVEQKCRMVQDGIGLAWTLRRRGLLQKARGEVDSGNQMIQSGIEKLHEVGGEMYLPDFEKALGPIQTTLPGLVDTALDLDAVVEGPVEHQ